MTTPEEREAKRERQARWRARHRKRLKQERAAKRERHRQQPVLDMNGQGRCVCCGEVRPVFLLVREDGKVWCHNCDHAQRAFGLCPHQAISRRLG